MEVLQKMREPLGWQILLAHGPGIGQSERSGAKASCSSPRQENPLREVLC
jgi:hypothetical protein